MLEMRPACERCAADLPPTSSRALICSHECTWCRDCATGPLGMVCPNCGGQLTPRPARVTATASRRATAEDLKSLTRLPDRAPGDRGALDALLDEVLVGTLSTVVDGLPWVVPMLFARDGDRVILHGSTGAGALRHVAAGAPAALCVTAVDGIVVAESTFESSMNYRSAVIRGELTPLAGDDKARVLDLLSQRILPERVAETRPNTKKELAATLGVALPITEDNWILKRRDGHPGEPQEEHAVWCGVIPLALTAGAPVAAPWSVGPVPVSVYAAMAAHGRMAE